MNLREIHELNKDQLRGQLSVVAAKHPMTKLGQAMQSMVLTFEAEGVYRLLQDLDQEGFYDNLQHAVHARCYFLRKSREQGSQDQVFTALSRTRAVFCALASGQAQLGLGVRALSPQQHQPAGEYPEDYAYYGLVHALLAEQQGKPEPRSPSDWLLDLESHVSAIPRPAPEDGLRVRVCRALIQGDERELWSSFEELAESLHDHFNAAPQHEDGMLYEFPWRAAPRYVSTELLGLLELARSKGSTPPKDDYPLCPSVARAPATPRAVQEVFSRIESLPPPTP